MHPRLGLGEVVNFANQTFKPGAWLYADLDGIVVSDTDIRKK
ncbi:MAG: hypothetical protein Q8Q73_19265 [Stagnimonas sp.]|nr:hypothetical protein [Stagnimonas sp.]